MLIEYQKYLVVFIPKAPHGVLMAPRGIEYQECQSASWCLYQRHLVVFMLRKAPRAV